MRENIEIVFDIVIILIGPVKSEDFVYLMLKL